MGYNAPRQPGTMGKEVGVASRKRREKAQKKSARAEERAASAPMGSQVRKLTALPRTRLLFASGNAGKLAEFEQMGAAHALDVLGPKTLAHEGGAALPEVEESALTFLGNALLKAESACLHSGLSAVADDSGLTVDALDGAPGVRSARFAGEQASDADNIALLLQRLSDVPEGRRGAAFRCALVLCGPLAEGEGCGRTASGLAWRAFEGAVHGHILAEARGSGGFGYDPVFYCPEVGGSFGEAGAASKHAVSHRGRAFVGLMAYLEAARDAAARGASPLFLRKVGLETVATALADTLGGGLRYADKALERALRDRPQLGPKERSAVTELLLHALRNLGRFQLAIGALQGEEGLPSSLDPRRLRASDAGLLTALAAADLDPNGVPMIHQIGVQGSALDGLAARDRSLDAGLPAERVRLAKALRAATHRLEKSEGLAAEAQFTGVHPDLLSACRAQLGPTHAQLALAYLRGQGPLTLRTHPGRGGLAAAEAELAALGVRTVRSPLAPDAVICLRNTRVTTMEGYAAGRFEIQDAGSQVVAAALQVQPGERVADWCAGAGGKTLALAAAMQGRGHLVALDTHAGRLAECRRRLQRAGETRVEVRRLPREPAADRELGMFDAVLVDSPCSSTGALRRTPELRWHQDAAWLGRFAAQQLEILRRAAARVKPTGRLVYATCSILAAENEEVVALFVAEAADWTVLRQERVGPANEGWLAQHPLGRIGPDGFYLAVLRRNAPAPGTGAL